MNTTWIYKDIKTCSSVEGLVVVLNVNPHEMCFWHNNCANIIKNKIDKMYLIKTPKFIQTLFPNFIWNIPTSQKEMFLTFDDGPIPEVTPWVLDTLAKYDAKATFFCVGDNVQKHPDIFQMVEKQGHAIGNHTFNHLAGWSTENIKYFHNVRQCAHLTKSDLFRPPYGRIRPSQAQFLTRHYNIIMWDVLSGDFDRNLSKQECADNVISKGDLGSIVVFHDSLKAQRNMRYALQKTLDHFSALGYQFKKLDHTVLNANKIPSLQVLSA